MSNCNISDGNGRPGPDFWNVPSLSELEGKSEEEIEAIKERYYQEGLERMRKYYAEKKGEQ